MRGTLQERMLPAPTNGGFRMEGYWIWCGSVIKGEDGKYHMFASRWSKDVPMHPGWLIKSEIVRAVADTPIGPFAFQEIVLPARGARYWDGVATHCPHIVKVEDTYVLYYIGTTHPFPEDDPMEAKVTVARANKRIGIATSKSVYGPWKRKNMPVLDTRPEYFDSFLVTDPAPCVMKDGSVYMMYKTRAYLDDEKQVYGGMTFGMAKAQTFGHCHCPLVNHPLFSQEICLEDPFVWHDGDGFNMMAKDMRGNVCGEPYGGVHAFSEDGIHWNMVEQELFYSRKVLWDDGRVRSMGNMERPFLLFEDGRPTHAYFAVSDGKLGFLECENTWNMVIPLK